MYFRHVRRNKSPIDSVLKFGSRINPCKQTFLVYRSYSRRLMFFVERRDLLFSRDGCKTK